MRVDPASALGILYGLSELALASARRAKRDETRDRRVAQAVEMIKAGRSRS